jgi:hypothetical protein
MSNGHNNKAADLTNVFEDDFEHDFEGDFEHDFESDIGDAFAKATLVTINGRDYYRKKSLSKSNGQHSSVDFWNYLYGNNGVSLQLPYSAEYYEEYDYFPVLGTDVPKDECNHAINEARKELLKYNMESIESNNCNNVRKLNDQYYTIDTNKIVEKQKAGTRTNTKKERKTKTKKEKKTKTKKEKKTKTKKGRKTKTKKGRKTKTKMIFRINKKNETKK